MMVAGHRRWFPGQVIDQAQAQVLEARGDGVRAEKQSTNEVYPHLRASGSSADCAVVVSFPHLHWTACSESRC